VQQRGDADPCAEVLGIGRDGEQGLGRGLEQDAVDDGLILASDVGDPCRQREYHVEIRHKCSAEHLCRYVLLSSMF
jgi:hypothetical protein